MFIDIKMTNTEVSYGDIIITSDNRLLMVLSNDSFDNSFDYALCQIEDGNIIEVMKETDKDLYMDISELLKDEYGETIVKIVPSNKLLLTNNEEEIDKFCGY